MKGKKSNLIENNSIKIIANIFGQKAFCTDFRYTVEVIKILNKLLLIRNTENTNKII